MYRPIRQPSRTPAIVTSVALTIVAVITACMSHGDKKKIDTIVATQPPAVVTPDTSVVLASGEVQPVIVTFASAQTAYNQRKFSEAEKSFGVYVERHPNNAFGYYMLGLSAWKNGEPDRAREALEKSLALDSTNVKTLLNLGRVLLEQGKPEAAGNAIGAFLNQVGALVQSGRLAETEAGPLRDQAACVRTQLHG